MATGFKTNKAIERDKLHSREILFIALTMVATFISVALFSYHPHNPDWSNAGGKVGAVISSSLLHAIGYAAFLIPIYLFYLAARALVKIELAIKLFILRCSGLILLLLLSATILDMHLVWPTRYARQFSGGVVGHWIKSCLLPAFNFTGSGLLLIPLLLISINMLTGLSWFKILIWSKNKSLSWLKLCPPGISYLKLKLEKLAIALIAFIWRSPKANKFITPIIQAPSSVAKNKHKNAIVPVVPAVNAKALNVVRVLATESITRSQVTAKEDSILPNIELLKVNIKANKTQHSVAFLENMAKDVEKKLLDFGIAVKVVAAYPGPVITRFELELSPGLKVSKISTLVKDLARALSVVSVRVVEIIPGKSVVGLEIPNVTREVVYLRDLIESNVYADMQSPLTIALGKNIAGDVIVANLAKMPHLLVAGTTGSGKSVAINAMLLSILYKAKADEVRLILIDPKMLELSIYAGIPHLLAPVVTDMKDAANVLRWCVAEMEERYKIMSHVGVRNLEGYNNKILNAKAKGSVINNPTVTDRTEPLATMPYIVVIIDEFADMIMVVGKKVEELIARIAQKARAAGIHMILATQRPSVDVITGLIKANIPTRIAFQVSSRIDSRTILDQQGAEQLLGSGDMLYLTPGSGIPVRVHGAFVADEEVHDVVADLKRQGSPHYELDPQKIAIADDNDDITDAEEQDPLYDEAVAIVVSSKKATISYLQRRLKIGYNRAARLIEAMEKARIVSDIQSNGVREILVASGDED